MTISAPPKIQVVFLTVYIWYNMTEQNLEYTHFLNCSVKKKKKRKKSTKKKLPQKNAC